MKRREKEVAYLDWWCLPYAKMKILYKSSTQINNYMSLCRCFFSCTKRLVISIRSSSFFFVLHKTWNLQLQLNRLIKFTLKHVWKLYLLFSTFNINIICFFFIYVYKYSIFSSSFFSVHFFPVSIVLMLRSIEINASMNSTFFSVLTYK